MEVERTDGEGVAEDRDFKASTLVYWASCLRTGIGGAPRAKKREPHVRMVRAVPTSVRVEDTIVVAIGAARVAVRTGFDPALLVKSCGRAETPR
jgi:hypothetical protein